MEIEQKQNGHELELAQAADAVEIKIEVREYPKPKPHANGPSGWEKDYLMAMEQLVRATPEHGLILNHTEAVTMRDLFAHMLDALKGNIPGCLTCMDTEQVAVQSGYTRCGDCKPAPRPYPG